MAARKVAPKHPKRAPAQTSPGHRDLAVRALLVALFLVGTALRVANLAVPDRSPDERIYAAQARAALQGIEGTRRVVEAYRQDPQLWLYPPPTRIGYANLLAAAMTVAGVTDESAGTYLSCLAGILTLLVAIRLGLRFLGPWITVFGVLLLAVFPPELVVTRRCWTDASVGLAGIVMLYLTLEIRAGTKTPWAAVLLPVAGSVAVLIKETTVLIYAPCLAAALWALLGRARNLHRAGILLAAAVTGAAGATALLALSTGGLGVLFRILIEVPRQNAANAYALEYCSGPAYLLPLAFWRLSPLTSMLGVLGLALAWTRSNVRDRSAAGLLAALTIAIIAPYALFPHWLNLRYASAAFAPLCLCAGLGLYRLFLLARTRLDGKLLPWVTAGAAALAVILAVADYQRFDRTFVRGSTPDLSVKMVLQALDQESP